MKKKLITCITITCAAFLSIYVSICRTDSLFISNVNALSRVEGTYTQCYNRIHSDPTDTVIYCGTCSEIPGRWQSGSDFCNH